MADKAETATKPKEAASPKGKQEEAPPAPKSSLKGFNPAELTKEQQEAVVEEYLGVHPKYFVYEGLNLKPDIWNLNSDRKHFNGWKPHLEELS